MELEAGHFAEAKRKVAVPDLTIMDVALATVVVVVHEGAFGSVERAVVSNKSSESPISVTLTSNPEELVALKAEPQQKLLQIQEFEGRARQDSNLRPSDS